MEQPVFDDIPKMYEHERIVGDGWHLQALYFVLVESGLRLGEALKIRWPDLVMKAQGGLIRLWRADVLKNEHTRTVLMTNACYEALLACREVPIGPFSTITKWRVGHVWEASITEPQCVIHLLRHTCTTRLLETVGDIKLVQE